MSMDWQTPRFLLKSEITVWKFDKNVAQNATFGCGRRRMLFARIMNSSVVLTPSAECGASPMLLKLTAHRLTALIFVAWGCRSCFNHISCRMLCLELVVVFLLVIPYPSNDIRGLVVRGIKGAWRSYEFARKLMYAVTVVNMVIFSELFFLCALRIQPRIKSAICERLNALLSFAKYPPLCAYVLTLERFGMLACVCAHTA
jgi:hypothetical protein